MKGYPCLDQQNRLWPETLLIYHHVTPYGTFRLDLAERMQIEETA
jgi:hypothetical protein